jgi:hypothetical protein
MPTLDQPIDFKNPLGGTISAHNQHLIISTGRADWTSRIEDEAENGTAWGRALGDLKGLLGRKGEFQEVCKHFVLPWSGERMKTEVTERG